MAAIAGWVAEAAVAWAEAVALDSMDPAGRPCPTAKGMVAAAASRALRPCGKC